MERDFFSKKMPRRSRAIFSGSIFLFYGFMDSDACDFWIGLDLVFLLDWILLTVGLGLDLVFGFSFGLDFGFLGLDVFAGFVQ
ncbi:MAG: hypothetical protein RIS13_985 [Bacteroidota bacterium]|jgi:hypothetical protein